jgi:hypothetical protein
MNSNRTDAESKHSAGPSKWHWITLLIIIGYEASGAIAGGILLIAAPDGRLMDMPVNIMHGMFRDFLVPGFILIGLGILTTFAFVEVYRKSRFNWAVAGLALGGLLFWFIIEISILQKLHWLHIMWGLPVVIGCLLTILIFPFPNITSLRILLYCGILSSLLYVALNIFIPIQWESYDSSSQTVSELSAVGAPTRLLWMLLCIPYTVLVTLFGWGVWKSANQNRALSIAGRFLVVYGALGIIWPLAPMHLRETLAEGGGTLSDTIHLLLGAVTEILFLFSMGFAAAALGRRFLIYTLTTFVFLVIFGVLTFLDAPGIAVNLPTPLLGIWERINIGVFLLWIVVLAITQLRSDLFKNPAKL